MKLENEFLKYLKPYLIFKLNTLNKNNMKESFNVQNFIDKYNNSNTLEDLHNTSKEVSSNGLKQILPFTTSIKIFIGYLESINFKTLLDVDTNTLKDFINIELLKKDYSLAHSTRVNYRGCIKGLFKYIDENKLTSKPFEIKNFSVLKEKALEEKEETNLQFVDWMDNKMITRFNKEILKYNFPNEFERCRDILIARIFLFSGIEPNEMRNLSVNDFIFEKNMIILHVKGTGARNRKIPMSRKKLIVYFNKYMELKENDSNRFFYSPKYKDKAIDTMLLSKIVKRLLVFAKIDVLDTTPLMLRKTFAIFQNNTPDPKTGLTMPEKNIQEMMGLTNSSQLKEILKFHTIDVMTASSRFDGLKFE